MKTVVGLYENADDAQSTLGAFARLGLAPGQIGTLSTAGGVSGASTLDLGDLGRASANSAMLKLLDPATLRKGADGLVAALLRIGVSHADAARCVAGLKRGAVLEAVTVDDAKEADVLAIMEGRSRQESARAREAWGRDQDIVIPVIEEELSVGTREVDAGGVRVTTHVSARPVEKIVTVREERVTVERRVVDRPIDEYDDVFGERTVEMKASAEEPVIAKRAHVVEEIRMHKDTTERKERVQDALRHTDVQLTDLPADRAYVTGQASGPAFEFGKQLRGRMPDRTWRELESSAKAKWEESNPGTWERYNDAIRRGWETGS